jgi:hypothetical protein
MKSDFERALCAQRKQIRARWLEILLGEQVATPLANPRTLWFLMDETLDRVFALLRRRSVMDSQTPPVCTCGLNPYLSYFRALTQAMFEALVQIQAGIATFGPDERGTAFHELGLAINTIAKQEIETIGLVCMHRGHKDHKASAQHVGKEGV